jgi:hypothetical protein
MKKIFSSRTVQAAIVGGVFVIVAAAISLWNSKGENTTYAPQSQQYSSDSVQIQGNNNIIYKNSIAPRFGHEIVGVSTLHDDHLYHTLIYSTYAFQVGARMSGNFEVLISPADPSFKCATSSVLNGFDTSRPAGDLANGSIAYSPVNIFWDCVSSSPISDKSLSLKFTPTP